jgi:hypothetical protein
VYALGLLVVVILLFAGGLWARRRCGLPITSAYRSDMAILAGGSGLALVGVIVPAYVIVKRAIYGGTIGDNLPAGVSEDTLLNLVVLDGIITIVAAVNRFLERIRTE